MKNDILTATEVKVMVDAFYGKVRKDALLGGIFNGAIQDRWPEHLAKMNRFWQAVLFQEQGYHGNPFAPHAQLPIGREHFDRWLLLFYETLDENFQGEKTEEARWRAEKMAEMFHSKIEFYKNSSSKPLI